MGPAPRPSQAAQAAQARAASSPGRPISRQTIDLVQASWAKVMPISDAAAALFYDRLFELDPSVRPLFKADMSEQKKKLMQTLTVAVDGLNNLDRLVPVLQALGVRHAGYMVADHHYDVVGEALLWTLREGLGDEFTSDVEAAWTRVYTLIADVMKKAAADHAHNVTEKPDNVPIPLAGGTLRRETVSATLGRDKARAAAAAVAAAAPPAKGAASGQGPSARTVSLVQSSWAKVMPISDAAATLFYDRLFELDPTVRPMFKPDLGEQKKKLMQTLTVAVDGLSNVDRLVPVLKDLGARHRGYMVADRHYDLVGAALLWTLREGLGDELTEEVEGRLEGGLHADRGRDEGRRAGSHGVERGGRAVGALHVLVVRPARARREAGARARGPATRASGAGIYGPAVGLQPPEQASGGRGRYAALRLVADAADPLRFAGAREGLRRSNASFRVRRLRAAASCVAWIAAVRVRARAAPDRGR